MSLSKKSKSKAASKDRVLITWDKMKCMALALAVEHQQVPRKKNSEETVANWKAVTVVFNDVFAQEDAEFRKAFPNGLPNADKLRSEFSDRYRGRHSNKWHTRRDQCSEEEIQALEHIARVVIATERRLATESGTIVQAPGPNAKDWVSYDVRPKSSAANDKGKQRAQPAGSGGSDEAESLRGWTVPEDDYDDDDDDDETAAAMRASRPPTGPKRAYRHLASASDQGGESSATASTRAASQPQQDDDAEDGEEDEYQTIRIGPRLTKRTKVPKNVHFPSSEDTGRSAAETTASCAQPAGQMMHPGTQTGAPPSFSAHIPGQSIIPGSMIVSGTQGFNISLPSQPTRQVPVSTPALALGEGISDPHHAAMVNREQIRRSQTSSHPTDFLQGLPVGPPALPTYPIAYYGDGITEAGPQPVEYNWQALKRTLLIGMQARRWTDIWEVIKETPAINLDEWRYDKDLVDPLAKTTGIVRPTVDAAVTQALHRFSTSSRDLQHLLSQPIRFPARQGDRSDVLNTFMHKVMNNPQLLMLHRNAVDFANGQLICCVREQKTTVDPFTGQPIVDPVSGQRSHHIETLDQRKGIVLFHEQIYNWAGEVRRVIFGDKITGQAQQADVMLCDTNLCINCNPNAVASDDMYAYAEQRNSWPLVHQKDVIMSEDTALIFAPREHNPPAGLVEVSLVDGPRQVYLHGTKPYQALFCNKYECPACSTVPTPVSLTFHAEPFPELMFDGFAL